MAWRTRSMPRSGGEYWILETGRNATRRTLSLRYVTAEQAERARVRMQQEEDDQTVARVWWLHENEPERAIAYLLGDDALPALSPETRIDYGAMTLTEYFEQVFWPIRVDASSPIGVSTSTAEAEAGYWRHKGGTKDKPRERRGILDGDLGRVRLRDLDDQVWQRWQDAQVQLSGRAKVLYRNAYSALLTWARRQGHTAYRPEFFRIKGSTKRTRPQVDPLSLDEVLALLAAAGIDEVPLRAATRRAMWAVACGQGLRPGELVRVEWVDVDWMARVLTVRGTKNEESAAAIPMTPLAHRELRDLWLRLGQPTTGPCFRYHRALDSRDALTAPPIRQYKGSLASDAKQAGIERHVTPYLLRHSFATIAWSLGIAQDVARRVMRHTNDRMLDEVYCRPRPADLVARVGAFDLAPPGG